MKTRRKEKVKQVFIKTVSEKVTLIIACLNVRVCEYRKVHE